MTIEEHLRKEAAGELGVLEQVLDMLERDVDRETMKATLERRIEQLEKRLELSNGKGR